MDTYDTNFAAWMIAGGREVARRLPDDRNARAPAGAQGLASRPRPSLVSRLDGRGRSHPAGRRRPPNAACCPA